MASLPDYMVPSVFAVLETLPLTPSGKVDRKALPAPDSICPQPDETFAAPRTQTEWEVARIWSQLLKVDKVGIHDNFFRPRRPLAAGKSGHLPHERSVSGQALVASYLLRPPQSPDWQNAIESDASE